MANIVVKAKLSASDMAHSGIAAMMEKVTKGAQVPLGTIVGVVRALSARNNPQDPNKAAIGLKGVFEAIPADPDQDTIRSEVCFLPTGLNDMIVNNLTGGKGVDVGAMPARGKPVDIDLDGKVLEIGVEVAVKKTEGAGGMGYEYVVSMQRDPTAADPLAELRKRHVRIGNAGPAPQLNAPMPTPEAKAEARATAAEPKQADLPKGKKR